MRKPDDDLRLRHMRDAASKAIDFCQGKQREDLDVDEKLALALVRLVEVVGEAAKGVSEDRRHELAAIPWRQIVGTRDRLIHGYFDVNLDIVWTIVKDDLPPLVKALGCLPGDGN